MGPQISQAAVFLAFTSEPMPTIQRNRQGKVYPTCSVFQFPGHRNMKQNTQPIILPDYPS